MRRNQVTVTILAAALVVAVTTVSLGVLGLMNYLSDRNWEWKHLRSEGVSKANELSAALSLPMWNFDRPQIRRVIESQMDDPDVRAVVVRQADVSAPGGVVTYARLRDDDGEVRTIREPPAADGLLVEERRITTPGGETLGTVDVYMTPRVIEAELRVSLRHLIWAILLLDALLSAGLYFLLWRAVLRPLKEIERYATLVWSEARAPTYDARPAPAMGGGYACRELQSLRNAIENMVRLLRTRFRALRKNETMLSTVLNSVPHCIFWKDAQGTYLGCNETLVKVAGLRNAEEIVGKTDFDLPWPREYAERYLADDREVMATNLPKRHIIEQVRGADGLQWWSDTTKVPLPDAEGKPSGVLGVAEDITERKEAEEALRREKAITDAVFDSVPAVISLYDDQGRLVRWNRQTREMSGFSDEELATLHVGDSQPVEERGRTADLVLQILRDGRAVLEATAVSKAGDRIPFYFTGVRLMLDGKPHILAVGVDIRERKQAEEHLRRALEQAEAANRAKDQFLAAASHELRTPLTPVLLLSSSLEADPHLPPEARRDLAIIREHVEIERRLIGDLLDFTAIRAGKLHIHAVDTDVNEVLQAAVRTCQEDAGRKGQRLVIHLDARHHFVRGDPDRLRQVFWNLVQNACKFTPEKGTITIRTRDGDDRTVRVEVSDTGMGMGPETLQKLFRPFEQGPRNERLQHYGGLGLGLAISKALVEAHGGSVSATSGGPDRGSTFIVRLPAITKAVPQQPTAGRTPTRARGPLRLLLVEDHDLTLKTLRRLLTAEGHQVETAKTVAEALAVAAKGQFDLVLSDIGLPDGSGCELMPILKDRYGLRGIALSGFGADGDLEASRKAGFLAHLTKPVTIEALREALLRFVADRRTSPAVSE